MEMKLQKDTIAEQVLYILFLQIILLLFLYSWHFDDYVSSVIYGYFTTERVVCRMLSQAFMKEYITGTCNSIK